MSDTDRSTMSPAEMRAYIEEAPLPGDGLPIYDRFGVTDEGYDMAGRSLAHGFLVLAEEDPLLLDVPSREDDPDGSERANNDKLWQAFKERWPQGDDWLGGTTGFQFGWAHNAVRYVVGAEPVGNPAIVTISPK